jgi:pyruvate,water dikinase
LQTASFAVRSSAIHEDARDASFAGVLVSRLNVTTTDSVFSALRDIRDSGSAPAALSYSRRLNVPHSPRIAAVVQSFLAAEASGILFMREGHLVVEACWGLGPAVVEGLVRPDRWIISAGGIVISSHIADKDIAVLPGEHEGTKQTPVDPACRRRPCLTPESLQQLSRLAAECERLFGSPQDIEWAVASGKVWLLQSRPITT